MTPATLDNHRLVTANAVRELFGGVSDMTLWRRLADPELNFPKPLYIGRRRYWRESELVEWLEAQRTKAEG